MSNHGNVFRPLAPTTHDLSKAPAHIRDAFEAHVDWRQGEVTCLASVRVRPQTLPGARLYTQISPASPEDGKKDETVAMRVLDYTGRDVIAQLDLNHEDLGTHIKWLIQLYKTQGGDINTLLEM